MGQEFKWTETCGHAMTGKGTPLKTSPFFFEYISQKNNNSLCHNCPTYLSHKCPIPMYHYSLTTHFMYVWKFPHNEHWCASWCWCSPTRHIITLMCIPIFGNHCYSNRLFSHWYLWDSWSFFCIVLRSPIFFIYYWLLLCRYVSIQLSIERTKGGEGSPSKERAWGLIL